MNTDDNEKMLAQAAMRKPEDIAKRATVYVNRFGFIRPPVKRVKGFDQNTAKAERRKAARAKQHNKRLRRNPSHVTHTKPPVAV